MYHGLVMMVETGCGACHMREAIDGCLGIKRRQIELDGSQQWPHPKMGPSGTTKAWEMNVVQKLEHFA